MKGLLVLETVLKLLSVLLKKVGVKKGPDVPPIP